METFIQLGKQPGLEIDISPAFYAKFHATKTDKTVLSCSDEILKNIDKVNISLSGGIDSQFSLLLAKEFKKIYIYYFKMYIIFISHMLCQIDIFCIYYCSFP